MGAGLEVVTGFVTAPGTTLTAWTLATGNTLTVRNAAFDKPIYLLQMWGQNQVAGILRLHSPRLHDNVQGIRQRVTTADTFWMLGRSVPQRLIPQDLLVVEQTGSAVAGQIEQGSLLIYYTDAPGIAGRFIDEPMLKKGGVNLVTVETAITPGVAGGYSGQIAFNAQFDLLKANTDYAIAGYQVTAQATTVRLQGIDTGNLGVGGPAGPTLREQTAEWFTFLAHFFGLPLIPVINSANKAGILVDVAQNQTGTAVTIVWEMIELAPGTAPGAVQRAPGA